MNLSEVLGVITVTTVIFYAIYRISKMDQGYEDLK